MAAPSDPETTEIRRRGRQRLIGAIAIVVLAVVFVPMVLDPEPRRERSEPTLAIPAKDSVPPLAPPTKVAEAPPAPVKTEPAKTEPVKTEPVKTEPAKTEPPKTEPLKAEPSKPEPAVATVIPEPAKPAVPKTAPKEPAPLPSATPTPKLEGFAVQVGAFRDDDRLRQAREKLRAAKVSYYTDRKPGTDLTRLRAGPYKTREAAEKALPAVKAAGFQGQVVPVEDAP